jgi:hypothetical protein
MLMAGFGVLWAAVDFMVGTGESEQQDVLVNCARKLRTNRLPFTVCCPLQNIHYRYLLLV